MSDFPRLSNVEYKILDLLRNGQELYGLEMVKLADGSLKRGTIYVTLGRMVDKGYITSRAEHDPTVAGLPRRKYKIEALGQNVMHAVEASLAFMGTAVNDRE